MRQITFHNLKVQYGMPNFHNPIKTQWIILFDSAMLPQKKKRGASVVSCRFAIDNIKKFFSIVLLQYA